MADITITPASVLKSSTAVTYNGTAGATITAGQVCYLDTADNLIKLADSNGASTIIKTVKGIAANGASTGQPVTLITEDTAGLTIGGTCTQGVTYYLSNTAGGIAPIADLATGSSVQIIGVGMAANKIRMQVVNSAQATL